MWHTIYQIDTVEETWTEEPKKHRTRPTLRMQKQKTKSKRAFRDIKKTTMHSTAIS